MYHLSMPESWRRNSAQHRRVHQYHPPDMFVTLVPPPQPWPWPWLWLWIRPRSFPLPEPRHGAYVLGVMGPVRNRSCPKIRNHMRIQRKLSTGNLDRTKRILRKI